VTRPLSRLGRRFPEPIPVDPREPAQLEEAETGGHSRDGVAGLQQREASGVHALANVVLLGAETVLPMEGVPKRSFADTRDDAQVCDPDALRSVNL